MKRIDSDIDPARQTEIQASFRNKKNEENIKLERIQILEEKNNKRN